MLVGVQMSLIDAVMFVTWKIDSALADAICCGEQTAPAWIAMTPLLGAVRLHLVLQSFLIREVQHTGIDRRLSYYGLQTSCCAYTFDRRRERQS